MNKAAVSALLVKHFQDLYLQYPGEQFNCIVTAKQTLRKRNYPFLVTGYAVSSKVEKDTLYLTSEIKKVKPGPIEADTRVYVRTSKNMAVSYFWVRDTNVLEPIELPLKPSDPRPT